MKFWSWAAAALLCITVVPPVIAQSNDQSSTSSSFLSRLDSPLKIVRESIPSKPFSVIGPRGAILGQQDGSFEAWIFPWKIFSNLRITAEMQNYPVPIDVNEQAALIEVQPGHTTITFAHANFTIREFIFAPRNPPAGVGVLAFFQIEAVRPFTLTFQFTPEMKRMWPAPSDDHPSPEWVKTSSGGFYLLHLNFPDHAAALEMPGAEPGILAPYQERPKTYPLQFVLHYDPASSAHRIIPLLLATAGTRDEASRAALEAKLGQLESSLESLYTQTQEYYRHFLADHMSIDTPDQQFNDAFRWAEISIDQLKVKTLLPPPETALAAGFFGSGDSARPGFGWFFGRDSLWSLYALNSYGDFQMTRDQLEFLLRRQSPEGKIIHEWSQTADFVDWKSLPYAFASADATPLLLMAANDYLQISGDTAFLKTHWDSLEKAWQFECQHDSDGDGIYDNSQGSGWVESWYPKMPHQEIYLAALDQQGSTAFSNLAAATGHQQLAEDARDRAVRIAKLVESEYYVANDHFYAFSHETDGARDASPTIYAAVADWDGTFKLSHVDDVLSRWASAEFSTDWGTRDLSPTVAFYDPISYHQGSVWPLFTGWVSVSEYRNGRSLSGYAHLMQNADLTWAEDVGAVTELLSGELFRWLGRSTSHQLWSSAMVITPTVRGLFGLEWDAGKSQLTVTPSLPAQWNEAKLENIPIGGKHVGVAFKRTGTILSVRLTGDDAKSVTLTSHAPRVTSHDGELRIPLAEVEVGVGHALPEPGAITSQLKVLDQRPGARLLHLRLSAPANSKHSLFVRLNDPRVHVRVEGAQLSSDSARLEVEFPQGTGYVEKQITVSW